MFPGGLGFLSGDFLPAAGMAAALDLAKKENKLPCFRFLTPLAVAVGAADFLLLEDDMMLERSGAWRKSGADCKLLWKSLLCIPVDVMNRNVRDLES